MNDMHFEAKSVSFLLLCAKLPRKMLKDEFVGLWHAGQ